jgi:hypothetical protein
LRAEVWANWEKKKIQTSGSPEILRFFEHLEAHLGSSFGEVGSAIFAK